ncbi:ferritin-like domain-containing protein [Carboxydochorda subterranea]|uniref:Ferritin-like domain-containing protein n=1 Tax=Carboxydichorda subterranea TaxID=3109565 RepID=A0ABZ1C1Z7_9FIRM|nr:ferritin-like domain-containing protein [Limnochorda sp. L945t]WRP18786.1 ferritin-like domain-containing protein [Limnochorda sp. L945t]
MIQILPALDDDLLLHLFRKGSRMDWNSDDFDWQAWEGIGEPQRRAAARIITPVYLGEQTAMLGGAAALKEVAAAHQTSAQIYLASFVMDEARHFEAMTRLYRQLGYDPVGIREMPEMLRYHHRLRQGDKLDWAWGILISDVFARHFYHALIDRFPSTILGSLSQRIVVDEGRHQAFAQEYIRRALPALGPERRRALLSMRDDLLRLISTMQRRLAPDGDVLGIDTRRLVDDFASEIEERTHRLGLPSSRPGEPPAPPPSRATGGEPLSNAAAERVPPTSPARPAAGSDGPRRPPSERTYRGPVRLVTRCAGCLLALWCRPARPHPAPAPS